MEALRHVYTPEVQQKVGVDAIRHPAGVEHRDVETLTNDGPQTLHISVAEAPDGNPQGILLLPAQWSSFGRRGGAEGQIGEEERIGALAAGTGHRAVFLDFPGMGDLEGERGNELTPLQRNQLKDGRMTDLATRYWQAMQAEGLLTGPDGNPLDVAVVGHSLGSLTGAELAATTPEGVNLGDIYLSEPMALQKRRAAMLALEFATKGGRDDKLYNFLNYGAPTPTRDWTMGHVGAQVKAQHESHLLTVKAMAQGQQLPILKEAVQSGRLVPGAETGTQLHVVAGEYGLTDPAAMAEFVASLRDNKLPLHHEILGGEGHGYDIALPSGLARMAGLAIARR